VRTIAPEFSASIPSTVLACSALDEFQRLGVCGNDQITPVMTSLVSPQLHFHAYCSAVLLSTPPAPTHSKQVHASWLQAPFVQRSTRKLGRNKWRQQDAKIAHHVCVLLRAPPRVVASVFIQFILLGRGGPA